VTGSTLVLGLGNVLLRDEGIGVWVADRLSHGFDLPDRVTVLEGGTLGLDLLPRLDGVERLLLIDAVKLGGIAGEITRFQGDEVPAALGVKISPHQIGLADLLATARLMGRDPPEIVLWGMEPGHLDPGTDFSSRVARALPRLLACVLDELDRWGFSARPVDGDRVAPVWWEAARAGGAG
jgi:hydrogenase maturation protease